jgi:hypothetical protein
MIQVIDMVSSRGAIRGEELATVGALRNKLAALMDQFQKEQAKVASDDFE